MFKTYSYLSVIACYVISICKKYKHYEDGINIVELMHILRAMVALQYKNEKIKELLEKTNTRYYFNEDLVRHNFLDFFPSVHSLFKDQTLKNLTLTNINNKVKSELEEIEKNELIKEVADTVLSLPRNELLNISFNEFVPEYIDNDD